MTRFRHAAMTVLLAAWWAPALADDPCAVGEITSVGVKHHALYLRWTGEVRFNMDERIWAEFERVKDEIHVVSLSLSSCGGESSAMHKTIAMLQRIKRTHGLVTQVGYGATCSSACVPIFLQGTVRVAALASIWVMHQSLERLTDEGTVLLRSDEGETKRTIEKYYVPAGVSKQWLAKLRSQIRTADYWQTGRELWESQSGIITKPLPNAVPRTQEPMFFMPPVVCGSFCRG